MAPIDDIREERTRVKHRVTIAAKRLRAAIERNADQACITTFMTELERAYCDFEISNDDYHECLCVLALDEDVNIDEYSIVNGMNMKEYEASVFETYKDVMEMYSEFCETIKCRDQLLKSDSVCSPDGHSVNMSSPECVNQLNVNPCYTIHSSQDNPSVYNVPPMVNVSQLPVNVNQGSIPSVHVVNSCVTGFNPTATVMTTASSYPHNPAAHQVPNYLRSSPEPATAWQSHPMYQNGFNGTPYSGQSPWYNEAHSSRAHLEHDRFRSTETYIKKFSLPEFSGARRDWPEFQAVWRELAERTYRDKTALAYELKRCLKGDALDKVKNIYITRPTAYEDMWRRLSEHYDDLTASVQAALNEMKNLKQVQEEDYQGLIKLVDAVEGCFSQLDQLGKTECVTLREVDHVMSLLPSSTRMIWIRMFHDLSSHQQLQPFRIFMDFLIRERAAVARLAENQKKTSKSSSHYAVSQKPQDQNLSTGNNSRISCLMPAHANQSKHKTSVCREFKKLPVKERFELIKKAIACFRCLNPA